MKAKQVLSVVIAFILYLGAPLIAGLFAIGDRDGPRIYSSEYHTELYIIGYEAVRHEKPRLRFENNLERPLFYGLPRPLRTK